MDENSPSYMQMHRDDSGYGSPLLTHEYASPQQSSSAYYSYQHAYHPHLAYANNSFHMYDPAMSSNPMYNVMDASMALRLETTSAPAIDLCSSPLSTSIHAATTPSKDAAHGSVCPSYDYKIHWVAPQGRRRRQRTVFTQTNVQQLDSVFVHNQYPDIELRETLAAQMGVPESRIQVWFKNRRTRARTAHRQQLKLSESSASQ